MKSISLLKGKPAGFTPTRLIEIEISKPIKDIYAFDAITGQQYSKIQALVRLHGQPIGALKFTFKGEALTAPEVETHIWQTFAQRIKEHLERDGIEQISELKVSDLKAIQVCHHGSPLYSPSEGLPFISVVICTHERAERLRACLTSFVELQYLNFEIILVDNVPESQSTLNLFKEFALCLPNLKYIREMTPGLSIARNTGLRVAKGEIVAFTDDDVTVDSHWLEEIVFGFNLGDNVACVTGLVFPAELETQPQDLMEQYGGMGKGFNFQIFDLETSKPKNPLIPFSAGWFGVGANMAFKTSVLHQIGGFNPALGAGTPARGGEDLAIFFQVVTHQHQLVYNPAALIRHYHRRDPGDFQRQVYSYGVGLTAYLTSLIVEHPGLIWQAAQRIPAGIGYLFDKESMKNRQKHSDFPKNLVRIERQGMLAGPLAYLRSKISNHQPKKIRDRYGKDLIEPVFVARHEPSDSPEPLLVDNLLNNPDQLFTLLVASVKKGDWINSYLLAAGLNQIVEDAIRFEPVLIGKTGRFLNRSNKARIRLLGRGIMLLQDAISWVMEWTLSIRRLETIQYRIQKIVQTLSDSTLGSIQPDEGFLESNISELEEELRRYNPEIFREIIRIPSCFRSFDQHPDDLQRLSQLFREQYPDRRRPISMVGVRTSGSYLAPLFTTYLKAEGYEDVTTFTIRPFHKLTRHMRKVIKMNIKKGGLVLLTDDPPITGKSLELAVQELEKNGVPSHSVLLLLALFTDKEAIPPRLKKYKTILLPWGNWSIHKRMDTESTMNAIGSFIAPQSRITSIEQIQIQPSKDVRNHAYSLYRIGIEDNKGQNILSRQIFVEGVGLGYFGFHALAIKHAIDPYLPHIFGIRDGLIYREWLSEDQRLPNEYPNQEKDFAERLAAYVTNRHRALPVNFDVSQKLAGRSPAWEVAGNLLSQAFGQGQPIANLLVSQPLAKRLLEVEKPSIIDGKMALENWFIPDENPVLPKKIGFSDRDFSHLDLSCFDPVFDLANLASSRPMDGFSESLRKEFQVAVKEIVSPERWMLYQWIHLWNLQRLSSQESDSGIHAMSRVFQRYFSELFFQDLTVPDSGWLCALDIDGVLETHPFGFPQLTRDSALALRALIRHGFQPLLATGRSITEVKERCQAYHLPGGVGEYGSAYYNHLTEKTQSLLTSLELNKLDDLRVILRQIEGIHIDEDYRYILRAYLLDQTNQRVGLSAELISRIFSDKRVGLPLQVIRGKAQTDFVVKRIDKGFGLQQLISDLNTAMDGSEKPLVFAIGDTAADIPMFNLAARSFIPAHANPSIKQANTRRMSDIYQSGTKQAVSMILRHHPGDCPTCKWEPESRDRAVFLGIMDSRQSGRLRMLLHLSRLSLALRRK